MIATLVIVQNTLSRTTTTTRPFATPLRQEPSAAGAPPSRSRSRRSVTAYAVSSAPTPKLAGYTTSDTAGARTGKSPTAIDLLHPQPAVSAHETDVSQMPHPEASISNRTAPTACDLPGRHQ